MASTFFGLETARRGMNAQQNALYVTGNNISNANTIGYSRQRVNLATTTPYPSPGLNRPGIAGQLGTGATASSIQRIRDEFADLQYRTQYNKTGYFGALNDSLVKMEEILNEPSSSGLQQTMDKFWNSLQTLAANTENSGARNVVASTGQAVAETFNYYYNSLTRVQKDIGDQLGVKEKEINNIINRIAELNKQISEVEPHGLLPNDLYDARDVLVDQLSGLVNIKVTKVKPDEYGNAKEMAEGLYNIEIVKEDGTSYVDGGLNLIEVTGNGIGQINTISIEKDLDKSNMVTGIKVGTHTIDIGDFKKTGELSGIIENYGYIEKDTIKGHYPEMLENINKMTIAFVNEFNAIHRQGVALNETAPSEMNFFVLDGLTPDANGMYSLDDISNVAQIIKVNDEIMKDSSKIAAGNPNGDAGNNENAQKLAEIKSKDFSQYITAGNLPSEMTGNIDSFYQGVIGSLGVVSQGAYTNLTNSITITASIEERRMSASSVSLDEEMINMIKYQHGYNASARMITVVDEV